MNSGSIFFYALQIIAIAAILPVVAITIQAIAGVIAARQPRVAKHLIKQPALVVLIPAHDEAADIASTVSDMLTIIKSDGVIARVIVIADNCSDNTAQNARAAGVEVYERNDPTNRGKGHALSWAMAKVASDAWDGLIVLDADARTQPGFFSTVAAEIAAGTPAMQGFYWLNGGSDVRTAMMRLAFALINGARPLGRYWLGGSAQITGNGFALSRSCLERVPFHASSALAEDLEHGLALVAVGIRVKPLLDARIASAPATNNAAARSQRTRWEIGRLHALRTWLPRLMTRGSWVCWESAIDLLIPPLAIAVAFLLLVTLGAVLLGNIPAAIISGIGLIMPIVALISACRVASLPLQALLVLRHVPMYLLWKMMIYFSPRFWKQRAWVRTARQIPPMLLALFTLYGCGNTPRSEIVITDAVPLPIPSIPVTAPKPSDPILFPHSCRQLFAQIQLGDVLEIRVNGDPRFRDGLQRTVDPLGRVPLPLVGPLHAEGLLPEEFAKKLIEALRPWISEPLCEVLIIKPMDRQATILGAVNHQGPVTLRPDDTLLSVLAKAEGAREVKSTVNGRPLLPREAHIVRNRSALAIVDLNQLLRKSSPAADLSIAPGDLVQVLNPTVHTVVVLGEVEHPGPIAIEEGLDMMQVIALAGGATEDANLTDCRVVRGWWKPEGAEEYPLNLDKAMFSNGTSIPIPRDRDLIVVPRSGLAKFGYFIRQISPGILTFGLISAATK